MLASSACSNRGAPTTSAVPMPVKRWSILLLLCTLVSPLSATDDLGDLARAYVAAHNGAHLSLPSYARQTGLACSACHYQFLTLTPFGRKFKLNGYTLTNLVPLTEKDSTNGGKLSLSPVSLLAGMVENPGKQCIGVDSFVFRGARDGALRRFEETKSPSHRLHEMDYLDYFSDVHEEQLGLYLYDGDHAYEHQLQGLRIAEPSMLY